LLRQYVNNDVHHEGTKDTKDLGINSLTLNFVLFAIFVVKTQGSTLVAALPPWVLRGEVSLATLVAAPPRWDLRGLSGEIS
jgi:hypothetical protein